MANGKVLDRLESDIDVALSKDGLDPATRSVLQIQGLFIAFFRSGQEDHYKTEKMWLVHRINVGVLIFFASSVGTLLWSLFTDKIVITATGN